MGHGRGTFSGRRSHGPSSGLTRGPRLLMVVCPGRPQGLASSIRLAVHRPGHRPTRWGSTSSTGASIKRAHPLFDLKGALIMYGVTSRSWWIDWGGGGWGVRGQLP